MPERLQRPQEAPGFVKRVPAFADFGTYRSSTPAEGAAGALDPGRAQLPALDISQIRSRPRPCRSRCRASRTPRRPAAATGGRRAGAKNAG